MVLEDVIVVLMPDQLGIDSHMVYIIVMTVTFFW